MKRRLLALVGVLAVMGLLAAPTAAARGYVLITGDALQIENGGRCTLGYLWNADGRTYGLTAGHCANETSRVVRDVPTGLRGVFVSVFRDGYDSAVIDFGRAPANALYTPSGLLLNRIAKAQRGPVCHLGISSGVECGSVMGSKTDLSVDSIDLGMFYTTGMAGAPGDSGGPVWQVSDDGASAWVVGIWLGDYNAGEYGRFLDITMAFAKA